MQNKLQFSQEHLLRAIEYSKWPQIIGDQQNINSNGNNCLYYLQMQSSSKTFVRESTESLPKIVWSFTHTWSWSSDRIFESLIFSAPLIWTILSYVLYKSQENTIWDNPYKDCLLILYQIKILGGATVKIASWTSNLLPLTWALFVKVGQSLLPYQQQKKD